MNEDAFHFLFEFAAREPLEFIGLLIAIPTLLLFMVVATLKRVHPIIVWSILFTVSFGFSQVFPKNWNQRLSIALVEGTISAILVWWWFARVAPELLKRLARGRMRDN